MEPATRIERATCGLRTSADPTSDKLTPQETTNEDSSEVAGDGAGLSCPGSSVVAESARDNSDLYLLIKSPVKDQSQNTQQEQSPAKMEDL